MQVGMQETGAGRGEEDTGDSWEEEIDWEGAEVGDGGGSRLGADGGAGVVIWHTKLHVFCNFRDNYCKKL